MCMPKKLFRSTFKASLICRAVWAAPPLLLTDLHALSLGRAVAAIIVGLVPSACGGGSGGGEAGGHRSMQSGAADVFTADVFVAPRNRVGGSFFGRESSHSKKHKFG